MTTEENTKKGLSKGSKIALGTFVGYIVICGLALLVSLGFADKRIPVTVNQVAATAFHLESGKKYGFHYGSRTTGLESFAAARGGLFSSSAAIDIQTTDLLSVDYRNGNTAYILKIPTNKIEFHPDDSKPASLVFNLKNTNFTEVEYSYVDQYLDNPRTFHWTVVPYVKSTIVPLEENGWLQTLRPQQIMDKYLNNVSITLSSRDYAKILSG